MLCEGAWKNRAPDGATLAKHHAEYLEARGVTPEAARAAGYWTARRPSEIPRAFTSHQRRRTPTLIAPHLSPDGASVGWQKHDDTPYRDESGKPVKWASPPGDRARTVLSVHPWSADEVRRGTGPLWVCEGLTRGHALAPLGIPAVTYPGCYSWQKGGAPLEDWEHINLYGRLVYDVPDADYRTNENVQKALAARVRYLESRGARVLVVSVPEVNGDSHAGLDDYMAAGGDPEALAREARPFVPVATGRERLKKDDQLRRGVAVLRRGMGALESRKARECSALAVARYMVEVAAPAHGKPSEAEAGIKVRPSLRQIAAGVRVGLGTASRALAHLELEEVGFLKTLEPAQGRAATQYLLCYPSGGGREVVEHKREQGGAGKESQERGKEGTPLSKRDSSSSVPQPRGVEAQKSATTIGRSSSDNGSAPKTVEVPALRNSKLVHTWARKNGRRVVVCSDYFRRYGKKREAIIRYTLAHGDPDEAEIHEKFGSRSSRLRDFRRTWIKPMLDDGVLVTDGGSILPAPDWPEALERVRERTDEEQDNRLQDAKYANQRTAYRRAKDNPTEPTPELAGAQRVAEIVAAREEDQAELRCEEQRRKVGMTAEVFLADALRDASGFGWRELRALWTAKGGRTEDLRRAVKSPYQFRREHDDGPLYVERTDLHNNVTEVKREPAPVAVLREPEDWRSHALDCECVECAAPMPTYARAWSGA
jgi:hypothetical protein